MTKLSYLVLISLYKKNCNLLKKIYTNKPPLSSLNKDTPYLLRDFYIKTAYNCCATGQFKGDYVGLCALQTCIQQGVRCLDFEIYSYNNEPIVAASTANNNYIKETYNALELKEVLETITDHAFDATKTNCANDPLILNFRIMSTNLSMLENMGDLFEEYLDVYNNSSSIDKIFSLLKDKNIKLFDMVGFFDIRNFCSVIHNSKAFLTSSTFSRVGSMIYQRKHSRGCGSQVLPLFGVQ